MKKEKPTLEELEKILNSEQEPPIVINPDGSVSVLPTEEDKLREQLAAEVKAREKFVELLRKWILSCDSEADLQSDTPDHLMSWMGAIYVEMKSKWRDEVKAREAAEAQVEIDGKAINELIADGNKRCDIHRERIAELEKKVEDLEAAQ